MKASTQKPVAAPGANKASTPPPHFDKLRTMKTLRTAAFSEDQAGAIVESIDDAQRNLATKEDLNRAIGGLRTDMEKMELSLRADMERMRADMQSDFKRLYWYIPLVIGVAASVLGILSPS